MRYKENVERTEGKANLFLIFRIILKNENETFFFHTTFYSFIILRRLDEMFFVNNMIYSHFIQSLVLHIQ